MHHLKVPPYAAEQESDVNYSSQVSHVFFAVAFFLGALALLGATARLTAGGAVDLVTRPDLVFPRVTGFSSIAGA